MIDDLYELLECIDFEINELMTYNYILDDPRIQGELAAFKKAKRYVQMLISRSTNFKV